MAAIADRWSPRSFNDRKVEPEQLNAVFTAAQWAASAFNEQPWRFIVAVSDKEQAHERLLSCLDPFNRSWAKRAPVLALCFAADRFAQNGKPNAHAWHDLGIASGAMSIQATHEGLHTHFMAGILPERIAECFDIPEGFRPVTGLAMGYLGSPDRLPEGLREKEQAPRQRKPLSELVFCGAWGEPFTF
jgi:nitroreductase